MPIGTIDREELSPGDESPLPLPLVLVLLVCKSRLSPPELSLNRIAPYHGFCHSASRQVSVGLTQIGHCSEMAGGRDSHALVRSMSNSVMPPNLRRFDRMCTRCLRGRSKAVDST